MAIEDVDNWLYADGPEDLEEYFVEFESYYPPGEFHPGVCAGCGSTIFGAHGNVDTGDFEWICRACGRTQLMPECERSWLPGEPKMCGCDCGGKDFHVAVGHSTRTEDNVRYLHMVERCTFCGLLATFAAKKLLRQRRA